MSKIKRVLSMVMALCLLLTLLPMQILAAETEKQNAPVYAGVGDYDHYPQFRIQEAESEQGNHTQPEDSFVDTRTYNSPAYLTPEQAALKLRECMKQRQETFDLYVKYGDSDYNVLADLMFELAVAHTGGPTEGDYLLWHCAAWGGEVDREVGDQEWLFHYQVEMSYYTTAEQEAEMDAAVSDLLNTLDIENKNDYEKIKAVYDFICQNIVYDYATLEDEAYLLKYSAYAALIDRTAVCQGYATLFYRLMLEMGIDCRVIVGEVLTGEPHAWNIVKLGDVYYNVDATMGSEAEPELFFLRNSVFNYTHYRALDYCTTQFHMDYPMSETDYEEGVEGVPEYIYIWGTCGDDAYWGIDRDGNLTITGTGATYDFYDSYDMTQGPPWSYWRDGFSHVNVEAGITGLGDFMFKGGVGSHGLQSITLPETLTYIGDRTFLNCDSLEEVHLPNSLKRIGDDTFAGCNNLKTVTLGNSLEEIGYSAFAGCDSLTDIEFPETLGSIGGDAFYGCNSLTEITIPASVETADGFENCENLHTVYINSPKVGGYAFSNCTNLRTVVLSDTVTSFIGSSFNNCTSLEEITIPASVTKVGGHSFYGCTALTAIRFEGDAPQFEYYTFSGVATTAYYPACNPTWTEEVRQNYEGTITWVPYECHDYEAVVTPATCTAGGYTTYTCIYCSHSEIADETPAAPHQWSEGSCDAPRTCTACGAASGKAHGHIYADNVDGTCAYCDVPRQDVEARIVVHMFRMYNPNSGEHFYTGSEVERDNLIEAGWHYEGVAFTFPANTGAPVYRLYHEPTGEHLYTMDEAEKDRLLADGWNYEGVAFNSAYDTEAVQHRLHNPNATVGAYHFTFSDVEMQNLIDAGWEYQGIGWYSCWK